MRIPTGLEEFSTFDREMVIPTVVINGSINLLEKVDAFGELQKGAQSPEALQKGSHPLLGKRVRHLVSGKTGLVRFASYAKGRVIAVEYDDESRAMNGADELEII